MTKATEFPVTKCVEGTRTAHYTDVKTDVIAGDARSKMRKIGWNVIRLYYDSAEKDWQVGTERVKAFQYV